MAKNKSAKNSKSSNLKGAKLWDKGEASDLRMQILTAADDPQTDLHLVCADAIGSAAHAKMLAKQKILNDSQAKKLLSALKSIYQLGKDNKFSIPIELEDVHTSIESKLVELCGDLGKRIHAARSRNDQANLSVRLYLRSKLCQLLRQLTEALDIISLRFDKHQNLPMPGYTHLQAAMPSSVGLWLHSFYEALLQSLKEGVALYDLINVCPLGSSAGFGTNLPINRKHVAELLNFKAVQRSVIDCNNSRGMFEEKLLHWCCGFLSVFEKFAFDGVLFCSKEFGFISLPNELTTGSSIMPQKRNPDLLELLRARPARVRASQQELTGVFSKLPTSYHRDLQFTKAPLVRGIEESFACIEMFCLAVKGMQFNEEKLESAMYPELFATYYANNLVLEGMAFRDAYRKTAEMVKNADQSEFIKLKKEFNVIQKECLASMKQAAKEKNLLGKRVQFLNKLEESLTQRIFS